MQHCANPECPFLARYRRESEFQDDCTHCADCGSALVAGPGSARILPDLPFERWITVSSHRDAPAAYIAKSRLDAAGVPATIADEHTVGVAWLWSGAVGGVKVQVPETSLQAARSVLRSDPDPAPAEPGSYGRCPRCGSLSVVASRLRQRSGFLSLLFGVPFRLGRWGRHCPECGHSFRARPRGTS